VCLDKAPFAAGDTPRIKKGKGRGVAELTGTIRPVLYQKIPIFVILRNYYD
jgi:hypothetical protein